MALGTGVNVSKLSGCALMRYGTGVNVTKVAGCALMINVYLNPPVWDASLTFANGYVGNPYSQVGIWVTAGTPPVTYTLHTGTLPPGLVLSSSGLTGTLSGTPTTLGTYAFTLLATNSFGSAVSQNFSITISVPTGGGGSWGTVA
jgi:Putative Ig domain